MVSQIQQKIIYSIAGILVYGLILLIKFWYYKAKEQDYPKPKIHYAVGLFLSAISGLTFYLGINGLYLTWQNRLVELITTPDYFIIASLVFMVLSVLGIFYSTGN